MLLLYWLWIIILTKSHHITIDWWKFINLIDLLFCFYPCTPHMWGSPGVTSWSIFVLCSTCLIRVTIYEITIYIPLFLQATANYMSTLTSCQIPMISSDELRPVSRAFISGIF